MRRAVGGVGLSQGGRRKGSGAQHYSGAASPEPGKGAEEEMYRETCMDRRPTRSAAEAWGHGRGWKVATLNVRSLRKATMHLQIEQYMEERNVAVLCLQETMVAATTQYVVGDLLYVLCGHGGEEREYAGVGMVFRKDVRKIITGFEIDGVGRMLVVGLDLPPRRVTLMSVYAPHSLRPEDERVALGRNWQRS